MTRIPFLFIGAALIAGCSSPPEKSPEPERTLIKNKHERVSRDLTLSWDNMGRGGAAIRQPAYIHVLGQGTLQSNGTKASIPDASTESLYQPHTVVEAMRQFDAMKVADQAKQADKTAYKNARRERTGHSLYELSRWERFCDGGKGMDEADWLFVTKSGGADSIPVPVQGSCNIPTYDYAGYLDAWTGFCTGSSVSPTQRDIVRVSIRPKSQVNPCEALSE
ncbi:hypothetical protein [Marinobacterium aestuariivivens]|uniref:Lipoprotein n=1 Tax=Marinobacterium aestuariivivens TaxID=1698799 RepID=A0ABW2A9P2_9GAMM